MPFRSIIRRLPPLIRSIGSEKAMGGAVALLRHENLIPSVQFSTAATAKKHNPAAQSVARIIDSEIKCALDSDLIDCEVDIPDGFPFEIQDNHGGSTIILNRKYEDEIVKVEVDMPMGDVEECNHDEADVEPNIPLMVSITKGNGTQLQFVARASPNKIAIQSMSMKESEISEEQCTYEGPDFLNMAENLQKAFHTYLETRGLGPSTANFLLEYMISKDSKEYLRWLKDIGKFMDKY